MRDREMMSGAIMQLIQHGIAVSQWYFARRWDADKDMLELISQRRDAIYAKIEELAWEPQYYPTSKSVGDQCRFLSPHFRRGLDELVLLTNCLELEHPKRHPNVGQTP